MNKLILFLLTKTGLIRWIGLAASGWLASSGYINGNDNEIVAGAVVSVVTGVLGKVFETVKDANAKELQADFPELKRDGVIGPVSRATIRNRIRQSANPRTR
jgi:hypothetical protein